MLLLSSNLIPMNVKAKGYILGAIAAATYGMNPLFALPLYKQVWIRIRFFFQISVRYPLTWYYD